MLQTSKHLSLPVSFSHQKREKLPPTWYESAKHEEHRGGVGGMSNKRRIYLLTKQATTRHATRDTRFPDWGRHCGWSKFRRQNHFLPDFVSWTGTLMGRPTTTAAANHRFPPGLAWLVGSAMAAAVFTEVGLRGRCGSNRAEQRGAVSLSSSGGNNDDDDTAALLSSSWRTSHTRVLTLRYI